MTPMFVETLSSQSPEGSSASQSGAMKGKLRATQTSLEFSQTQTPGTTLIQHTGIKAVLNVLCLQLSSHNLQVNVGIFTVNFFFSSQVDVQPMIG